MQSRLMSLIEAWANVFVGYWVSVAANYVVLPWFGFDVSAGQAIGIGVIFTAISLVRSYLLRRCFNRMVNRNA